jgi:hypothetical protein
MWLYALEYFSTEAKSGACCGRILYTDYVASTIDTTRGGAEVGRELGCGLGRGEGGAVSPATQVAAPDAEARPGAHSAQDVAWAAAAKFPGAQLGPAQARYLASFGYRQSICATTKGQQKSTPTSNRLKNSRLPFPVSPLQEKSVHVVLKG